VIDNPPMQQSIWIKPLGLALLAITAIAARAQSQDWLPLGAVHDRIYVMNKPSLTPIEGGFTFGVLTDKGEAAEADTLPGGKKYRSSFLTVEVNCAAATFRIPRARFFSGGQGTGNVVAEDQVPPGEGWAPAQPDTIGASFVAAGCPGK
jgi:hypothetical protein